MQYRTESDSIGEVKISTDDTWGAQTQRSLENFNIGSERMPFEVIEAYALIKKAAAQTNKELADFDSKKVELIEKVCDEILNGCFRQRSEN